jgi:hypothetical protein
MRAAQVRGRHLGRPATPQRVVSEIKALATTADLSIRAIQRKIAGRASRGIVGETIKRARTVPSLIGDRATGPLALSRVLMHQEGCLESHH